MRARLAVVLALVACNDKPAEQPNAVAVPADAADQQPPAGAPASSSTPKTGISDASAPDGAPRQPAPTASAPAPSASASSSGPPPAKCPASYAAAQRAGRCEGAAPPTPCTYPEGTCDCVLPCLGGPRTDPQHMQPAQWSCTAKTCTPTPAAGATCAPDGLQCGRCWGDFMDCRSGKWVKRNAGPPP